VTNREVDCEAVIIGGGASGTLTAVHLLRAGAPGPIVLVERADRLGRGVAYSTTVPDHLLNVVASNLGGLAGQPEHFLSWLAEVGEPAAAGDFLPRMVFGRYLTTLLNEASGGRPGALSTIRGEAVALTRAGSGLRLELSDGTELATRHAILATGTPAARNVPLATGRWPAGPPLYLSNPWAEGALDHLSGMSDVLMVGTGLTMVDVALCLTAASPDVRLVGLSRTGLLPLPHRWPEGPIALGYKPPRPGTSLLDQVRAFRAAAIAAQSLGGDARDVVDAMRPHTQATWKGFSREEQQRFLRSYARFWAINRNRMAPAANGWVDSLQSTGQLTVVAGSIVGVEQIGEQVRVELRRRDGTDIEAHTVDAVVNCVGPADSPFAVGSPLYDNLLADGLARPHPLGLGRDPGAGGPVRGASGDPSANIFTIGWMRRGELWESVAIPEIRDQAAEIAGRVAPP
jgi:uncharacterized NAD(P)/FAD-binding protein YdhS